MAPLQAPLQAPFMSRNLFLNIPWVTEARRSNATYLQKNKQKFKKTNKWGGGKMLRILDSYNRRHFPRHFWCKHFLIQIPMGRIFAITVPWNIIRLLTNENKNSKSKKCHFRRHFRRHVLGSGAYSLIQCIPEEMKQSWVTNPFHIMKQNLIFLQNNAKIPRN